ncbi:MAG: hypothetical protein MI723_05150 [Caulobacterales bacterium]|nr:hypothetical protein [Caulobacterales bacterium]
MATRIKLPTWTALPVLALVVVAAVALRPAELRREPLLELQSAIGLEGRYEAAYADCADPRRNTVTSDLIGFARGFVGRAALPFAARDDGDAVAFARAARPTCRLVLVNRFRRWRWWRNEISRRVSVPLSGYPG